MVLEKIYNIIDKYDISDSEYSSDLFAITRMLPSDDLNKLLILLEKAEKENKKVVINVANTDEHWSTIKISDLILK